MYTVARREQVRLALLDKARDDERIVGAAITGSAASGTEDRWSDIDLFFAVADGHDVARTLSEWTAHVYRELGAVHHFNLQAGNAIYRAFLLAELLEIDLAFTPAAQFGPLGSGGFEVVFGSPAPRQVAGTDADQLIGMAWHHVLHARIFIERGTPWQAEHWISAIRDETLALSCLRLGLPTAYAKGADTLPAELTAPLQEALVRSLDPAELSRALHVATQALITELRETDSEVAERLTPPLLAMAAR
ncbi:MAG: nucleotidyltransferase domain-containing protein [Pseudonocardiales bacterium]